MRNYATGASPRPKWATAWCDICATNVKITFCCNCMLNWISIPRNQMICLKPFEAILLLVCYDWRLKRSVLTFVSLFLHTGDLLQSGLQNGCASPLNANWPINDSTGWLHLIFELDKSWRSVFSFEVCSRVLWGRGVSVLEVQPDLPSPRVEAFYIILTRESQQTSGKGNGWGQSN